MQLLHLLCVRAAGELNMCGLMHNSAKLQVGLASVCVKGTDWTAVE